MKADLIYDFNENKIIKAESVNIVISRGDGYLAVNRNSVEVTLILTGSDVSWASNWLSKQYDTQGIWTSKKSDEKEYLNTKRNIHIDGFGLMLYGCYLKSYSSIEIGKSEVIIGCDYHEKKLENLYKDYYRDVKINELLS